MNIVLKNSLKNIFFKPFRTILVVFAIFVCSLCALLCFDLGDCLGKILTEYLGSVSRADFMGVSTGFDVSELPEGFPEADYMTASANSEMLYKKIDGEYCYVTTESLSIWGVDMDQAVDMQFISRMDIGYGEMYVSRDFAENYGYEVGDKITIHNRVKDEMELTIAGIYPENTKNPVLKGNTAVVNLETSDEISCGIRESDVIFIDVKDDSRIKEAEDLLKDTFPDISITELFISDDDMSLINEFKFVFYLLFAITFLLVIFVTASICNRIVSERMSFIGTLRSLGMSTTGTGLILLLENVIFAILGSVPAVVLYSLIRDGILGTMFNLSDSNGAVAFELPKFPLSLVIGVVIGAVLIECLIPLRAILKALKTSIRDIIFDNRDTAYKFTRAALIAGIGCTGIAIVTAIFRANLICSIICLLTSVAAIASLFPWVLKFVSTGIQKIGEKHNKPSWSLAAVEAVSRKSTVGSGVLSVTAAAMCIVVYAVASGMFTSMSGIAFDCDVKMTPNKANKYYSYIEHMDTVTDVEPLYTSLQEVKVNDSEKQSVGNFYGLPDEGFRYLNGFTDLPEKIETGCVLVDSKVAKKRGVSEGDTIKITINPTGVLPIEREYKIQQIVDSNPYDEGVETFIVPLKEYQAVFMDKPGEILIKCTDPETVKKTLETYAKGSYSDVRTYDELIEDNESGNAKTTAVITTVIIIALGMTAIGMVSNQLIGFTGRKKECAVMLSTSMSKGKLSGILFKEVLITSLTACSIGTVLGYLLTHILQAAMDNTEILVMDVSVEPSKLLFFFITMTILFTVTVLFPIRSLRKMKISEQIKYE